MNLTIEAVSTDHGLTKIATRDFRTHLIRDCLGVLLSLTCQVINEYHMDRAHATGSDDAERNHMYMLSTTYTLHYNRLDRM